MKLAQLWRAPFLFPSMLLLPTKWDCRWTLAHTSHIPLPTHTHTHVHTHTTPFVPASPLGSHALPRLDTAQGLYRSAPLRPPSQLTVEQPSETSRTGATRPPDNSTLGSPAALNCCLYHGSFSDFFLICQMRATLDSLGESGLGSLSDMPPGVRGEQAPMWRAWRRKPCDRSSANTVADSEGCGQQPYA